MIKPYYETKLGKLYHGDCLEIMPELDPVDLVLTSPPYDDLREYGGYKFDFKKTAKYIFNNIKQGGIVVWVVGDEIINESETGTSFKQALYFKEIGFNLHDTMIYLKAGFNNPSNNRYHQIFEYMFIFSKGKPVVFNAIKDRENKYKKRGGTSVRQKDGTIVKGFGGQFLEQFGQRFNVWLFSHHDKSGEPHPATFPKKLANDHIISWSNKNDTVLDPFIGSGTTAIACERLNRKWIGIEIEEKYCEIAAKRIEENLTVIEKIERSEKGITKKTGLLF